VNRRSFLRNSALALFGFTVLPPAETYQRIWRAQRPRLYSLSELGEIDTEYCCVMEKPTPKFILRSEVWTCAFPIPTIIENFST